MRWNDVVIAGTGSRIAPLRSVSDAVTAGDYDPGECAENDYESVAVSETESAPEMAVTAARDALAQAATDPGDFGLVLHASAYYQGIDYWTPASYIQRQTIGGPAPAMEVSQASNGGLAVLELAAAYLTAGSAHRAVLITTGDRYCVPGFDRFRTERGLVFADGGTALVLTRGDGAAGEIPRGRARLLSTAHISVPELEEIYRGTDGFTTHSMANGMPLDVRKRSEAYLAGANVMEVMGTMAASTRQVVEEALSLAGTSIGDLAAVVLPNLGRPSMTWQFFDALQLDEQRTSYPWGRRIGHLGAGDQFAGLHHLLETGSAASGDRILAVGSGIGFSWSAAVLEVQ